MQNEIQRIFTATGHNVVFNNTGGANGGSYNLTVQQAGNPNLISQGIVAPGWTPANLSTGVVSNSGFASTDVLAGAIQSGLSGNSSQQALGRHPENLATGLGRVGAHEAGHYFLQLTDHPNNGVMRAGFNGNQWFSPAYNDTFRFTAQQAQQLARRC